MNVAIFTDNDFTKVNGVTTTLRAVLEHTPSDIRARVYTCQDRACDTPTYLAMAARGIGIPFYREMKMYVPPLGRLARAATDEKIDLIHLTTPGPVGLAAVYVASRMGAPIVGSFHTDLAAYTRLLSGSPALGRLMQQYMRWPYGKCQQVLAPSDATCTTLVDSGIRRDRLRVWRRGVSTQQFSPEKRSSGLRSRWGVSDACAALLYVGRLSREKGLDALPQISIGLRLLGLQHRWIIVGDGPMRAELTERCADAVFTGTLDVSGVASAMASADAFVFPSRTDTAGNVVLEAQASGLPVLVTDAGGPRENIVDGQTGFICPDAPAFTRQLHDLVSNPERRAAIARHARAYAETRSWPRALEPLFDAYREVAADATPRVTLPVWAPRRAEVRLRPSFKPSVPSIFQG